jgi:hypothetical protein
MHEASLASLVVNGMSHAVDNTEIWRWFPENWAVSGWTYTGTTVHPQQSQVNPPGTVLHFRGFLPGYAFNLDGIPIKIAVPILIIYCLYTTSYVLYTFITGRSSRVWSTMAEFTTLAINSSPTKVLKNTSAGIRQINTFRQPVSVREVENHGRLELVFERDEKKGEMFKRVVIGRGY